MTTDFEIQKKNINFYSASEIASKIRSGEYSSVKVVNAFFEYIEKYNRKYNAVVTLNKSQALKEAEKADRLLKEGKQLGLLHGVPITIKDNFKTKGILTTSGYKPLKKNIPDTDADIVKILKAEGAIIIGKTNLSILAMDMQTNNKIFGRTNNPWNINRTSGGSSGGCATAIAAGMSPLSFGNDLAGSIRLPSSYCGVYGLKPSYGVVSLNGLQSNPKEKINGVRTLACPGPIARNIEDLILALNIITKPSGDYKRLIPITKNTDNINLKQIKVAWIDELGGVDVDNEIKQKIQEFVKRIENAGISVTKICPSIDYNKTWKTWGSFVGMMGGYNISNFSRRISSFFAKNALKNIPMHQNIIKPISVKKYMIASNFQDTVITQLENFFNDFDVFICPVSATTAFKHHAQSRMYGNFIVYDKPLKVNGKKMHYHMATQAYTTLFNLTESPVLTMPIGLSTENLPIGIQLVGRRFDDYNLLNICKVLNEFSDKITYPLMKISKKS